MAISWLPGRIRVTEFLFISHEKKRGKLTFPLTTKSKSFPPVLCHTNPKTAENNISVDQEPKVVKGLLEQRKGSQEFGSYEKMEAKHSPRREGDESQDNCVSLGARLSFPTSERKLRKLRFYYNGIMR